MFKHDSVGCKKKEKENKYICLQAPILLSIKRKQAFYKNVETE